MSGLSESSKAEIARLAAEYPDPQSALLPALHLAQADYGGWLPEQAFDEVAAFLSARGVPMSPAWVAAVASFYTMFHRRPVGRHLLEVCTNVSCSLLGAGHLVEYLSSKLGVRPGETTPDGRFTLLEVECLGSCGTAPVMQVDGVYYESLTEDAIDRILTGLESPGTGGGDGPEGPGRSHGSQWQRKDKDREWTGS